MTASQVIESIKQLPAHDRAVVVRFVEELEEQPVGNGQSTVKFVEPAKFQAAADAVFEKHDELLRRLAK